MSFANPNELYRSSILKLLIGFAAALFLMMSLLIYQLYATSVKLYNSNLDDWLREESAQLLALDKKGGYQAVQGSINNLNNETRFIYKIVTPAKKKAAGRPANMYPVIAQIDAGSEYQIGRYTHNPAMHATTIQLTDGRKLLIGIEKERYKEFKTKLNISLGWGLLYPFLALLVIAAWIAVHVLKRLNLVNVTMNRVMSGERGVRLSVGSAMDEFDLLAVHLNRMLEQMEKSESRLKSLTVDIAHDLRTPMGRIKLRIEELLQSGQFNEHNENELENIQQDFALLLDTFNGMMELYNLETGRMPITKKRCNLSKIVHDVMDFTEPLAADKNQKIYLTIEMPCFLQANPSLLFRAVFNVLDNAIKYTPVDGVIEIIIDCFGLVIADNGRGIKPEDRERALDQLVRLDPSRSVHGFGLGLALVNTVMKTHNGQISLSDNYPGLRVRLLFNDLVDN
ncbi:HAMP domain-containing sensor histidine kinase [Psychromonas ossibalaenae]|uniref:HAMP domain-containing sensor histidine kinase n=1 Tax=Psychromonas ossibalaenae TaxID=444922 RepID=UPI000367787F|nr:HAMP domain-containing sensor histidine kinase [Psychromonas ossibalaenae]